MKKVYITPLMKIAESLLKTSALSASNPDKDTNKDTEDIGSKHRGSFYETGGSNDSFWSTEN